MSKEGSLIKFCTLSSIYVLIKDKVKEFNEMLKELTEIPIQTAHKFHKNILL